MIISAMVRWLARALCPPTAAPAQPPTGEVRDGDASICVSTKTAAAGVAGAHGRTRKRAADGTTEWLCVRVRVCVDAVAVRGEDVAPVCAAYATRAARPSSRRRRHAPHASATPCRRSGAVGRARRNARGPSDRRADVGAATTTGCRARPRTTARRRGDADAAGCCGWQDRQTAPGAVGRRGTAVAHAGRTRGADAAAHCLAPEPPLPLPYRRRRTVGHACSRRTCRAGGGHGGGRAGHARAAHGVAA